MTYFFVIMERSADRFNEIITLHARPNWLARLFGAKEVPIQFVGNGTVWHTFPRFRRCRTSMERTLGNIWSRETYARLSRGEGRVEQS